MKTIRLIPLLVLLLPFLHAPAHAQLTKIWESDTIFKYPESVAYDGARNCLYISNYNQYPRDGMMYNEDFITKTDINGKIIEYKFVNGLTCPTGICVLKDRLYIVERFGLVVFDLKSNSVETRYRINDTKFLNDVSVSSDGTIYISDSGSDIIYRIKNGIFEKWFAGKEIDKTNGVLVDGDKLLAGVNSDSSLKAINITDKTIARIAALPPGIIDGIKKCGTGYLVSHYDGNLYLVRQNGEVIELLNTRPEEIKCADFEYVDDLNRLFIPALKNNRLFIYQYGCSK
jgi:sugar lactone lactonase YvrE